MAAYRDESLVGQPLDEKEQQALDLFNQGKSDTEIAQIMGYGNPGSAGNVRRRALTKVGRGDEVRGGRRPSAGVTTSSAIPEVEQVFRTSYKQAMERMNSLEERLNEAREAAEATPEQITAREETTLMARVTEAQEALQKFQGQDANTRNTWIQQHQAAAKSRLQAVEGDTLKALDEAEAKVRDWTAKAELLGIDLSEQPESEDEESTDEGTEETTPEETAETSPEA